MKRLAQLLLLLALVGLFVNCTPRRSGGGGGGGDDDDDSAGDDDDATGDDDDATGDDDDATGDDDDATSSYACGWPTWSGADSLGDPGFGGSVGVGAQFPRVVAMDQCGEDVDLYHLAGSTPVIIAVHAMWSGPDVTMAGWLGGGDGSNMNLDQYDDVRDAIEAGELRWVTYIMQNAQGSPPDLDDLESWADDFSGADVPVLGGGDVELLMDWLGLTFIPNLTLVTEGMQVVEFSGSDWNDVLLAAQDQL